MPKYVLDTNCYIDAVHDAEALTALERFISWASPFLFLSAVVGAELGAGVRGVSDRKRLERVIVDPFIRRERVLTPGPLAWDALGRTLSTQPDLISRSFAFDVLLAFSAREAGAVLISKNAKDLARIRRVFAFEFVEPYPSRPERA